MTVGTMLGTISIVGDEINGAEVGMTVGSSVGEVLRVGRVVGLPWDRNAVGELLPDGRDVGTGVVVPLEGNTEG